MNRTVLGAALVVAISSLTGLPPASAGTPDLVAKHVTALSADLPATTTANPATSALTGTRNWQFFPGNQSGSAVSNLSVSVNSGLDPTKFYWAGPVSSFPVTRSTPTLAAGQSWDADGVITSTVPVNFTAGYDSTRTVSPPAIKVGGDKQTVTITVTPQDAGYSTTFGQFIIFVRSDLAGVTLVPGSDTLPGNLDQGEQASTMTGTGALIAWQLSGDRPRVGKTYTFSAQLDVPNTFGGPVRLQPAGEPAWSAGDGAEPRRWHHCGLRRCHP